MRNVSRGQIFGSLGGASRWFTRTHYMLYHLQHKYVLGLNEYRDVNTGFVVFVNRLSKMDHLAAVSDSINGKYTTILFIYWCFLARLADATDRNPQSNV